MAGLLGATRRIDDYYHAKGYPFAHAILPAQDLSQGALTIRVVEGRYGKIQAQGEPALAAGAQPYLNALKPGEVIRSAPLERATLLLSDLPGILIHPVMQPGAEPGEGDLQIDVRPDRRVSGALQLDNWGNRYTGILRSGADLQINNPLQFGDQLHLSALATEHGQWLGSLGYTFPLGTDGWRGNLGYSHSDYRLTNGFEGNGWADIASVGASYPLIRTQRHNLSLAINYQHKTLRDAVVGQTAGKYSDNLPLGLQFDWRDTLLGNAVTYGSVTWTHGQLHLDSTAQTQLSDNLKQSSGAFDKWNIDMVRVQQLANSPWQAYLRLSGQAASKNLDSSESFVLGGPQGVRAYPVGEAYGDQGILLQTEIRYPLAGVTPFAFYDYGAVRINANPWAGGNNRRRLSGGGDWPACQCR